MEQDITQIQNPGEADKKLRKKKIFSALLMLFATLLWGTSFAAQTVCTQYIGPLTVMALRSYVGALALLALMLAQKYIFKKKKSNEMVVDNAGKETNVKTNRKKLIIAGIICGVALALASGLQQWGIFYNSEILHIDSTGKAGFLTALYIIFVPICGMFFGRKPGASIIIGVICGAVGMYFLCVTGNSSFTLGDLMLIGCAFAYTLHILIIDKLGSDCDTIKLSFVQFLTCAVVLMVISLITERNMPFDFIKALPAILYLGIFSSAVAFTIQIYIQKVLHPAVASLIMSFESVFAALSGALFLQEKMSLIQYIACVIMFIGIITAQCGDSFFAFLKNKAKSKKKVKRN